MPTRQRSELGAFLRSRRERITPEDVGLPAGGRRRTPGLRREEVAHLAGVGVTWYTWLEQGRDINASVQVLDAVARTLRMDAQERWHLFQLAGVALTPPRNDCGGLGKSGQAVLDQLDPYPAVITSERWDILGFNRTANLLFGGLDDRPDVERNQLWLFFTDPHWRGLSIDRDSAARHLVGSLRAAMAEHIDDPLWTDLLCRLRTASDEFDALWGRHEIVDRWNPIKDFHSPTGDLHLQAQRFTIGSRGTARMVVYVPRDEVSGQRLEKLSAMERVVD